MMITIIYLTPTDETDELSTTLLKANLVVVFRKVDFQKVL